MNYMLIKENRYVKSLFKYSSKLLKLLFIYTILSALLWATLYLIAAYLIQLSLSLGNHFRTLDLNSNFVSFSTTVATLMITAIYVLLTHEIADKTSESVKKSEEALEENRKDRKIAHIEKQLEKLYYPLKDYIKSDNIQSLKSIEEYRGVYKFPIEEPIQTLDKIIPYTYLATSNMKNPLEDFINSMRYKPQEAVSDFAGKPETINKIDNIENLINKDITKLKEELDKLYNSAK